MTIATPEEIADAWRRQESGTKAPIVKKPAAMIGSDEEEVEQQSDEALFDVMEEG